MRGACSPNEIFTGVKREREPKGIFGCLAYAKVFVRGKQYHKDRKVVLLGHSDTYDAAMVRSVDTYHRSFVSITLGTSNYLIPHNSPIKMF